jgi:hypothetical protein
MTNEQHRELIARFRKAAIEFGHGDSEQHEEMIAAQADLYAALASAPAATQGEAVLHALMRSNGTGFVTYDGAPIVSESPVKPFEAGQQQVPLYTAPQPTAPAAAERAGPDGRLHADGYFTWNKGQRPDYIADRGLPCDFYLTPPQAPAPVEAPAEAEQRPALTSNEFTAWLPRAYRQPQSNYTVYNMEVAFEAGRAAQPPAPVEAPQQAQPAEHSVALPTNADQAALMSLLGMSWLQEHAPERLRTQPAGPSKDAERLDWLDSAKSGTIRLDDGLSIARYVYWGVDPKAATARQGIDAARAAQGGKGAPKA